MIEPPNLTGVYETDVGALREFFNTLSNGIDFDNLDGQEVSGVTATAGTPLILEHALNREPRRMIVVSQDKSGSVHMSAQDSSTVSLVGSVDTMAITVFIQ